MNGISAVIPRTKADPLDIDLSDQNALVNRYAQMVCRIAYYLINRLPLIV
jgi:hypothetical protein